MQNVIPCRDWILIEKEEVSSYIRMPEGVAPTSGNAVVAAVGPGELSISGKFVEPRVKIGDRVVIGERAPICSVPGRTDQALVRERDIMCILRDVPN